MTQAQVFKAAMYALGLLTMPATVTLALVVAGVVCVVGGVYVLAGFGWALLASGGLALGLAALLAMGDMSEQHV